MKALFFLAFLSLAAYSQQITTQPVVIDTAEYKNAMAAQDALLDRKLKMLKIHKALAYTTGGFLLATDAVGLYNFLSMMNEGHKYRNEQDLSWRTPNYSSLQTDEIKYIWNEHQTQAQRILHASLVTASSICYVSTAAIELSIPRLSDDPSYLAKVRLHRNIFFLHAALMAANIGLGFAESYALSQGNHNAVESLGVTHLFIGFALPVVMVGSGIVFK